MKYLVFFAYLFAIFFTFQVRAQNSPNLHQYEIEVPVNIDPNRCQVVKQSTLRKVRCAISLGFTPNDGAQYEVTDFEFIEPKGAELKQYIDNNMHMSAFSSYVEEGYFTFRLVNHQGFEIWDEIISVDAFYEKMLNRFYDEDGNPKAKIMVRIEGPETAIDENLKGQLLDLNELD